MNTKACRLEINLYADILNKIITGQLPPGSRLTEQGLAHSYHVSRTPIREVLISLQEAGLVERNRNRGAKVAAFGPDDVEQIYEVRSALECLAVRRAVHRLALDDLLEIERRLLVANQCASEDWIQQQIDIDISLHQLITSQSGNRLLAKYLENISSLIHSLRLVGYCNEKYALATGEEHLDIVRALTRRDAPLAECLLAAHINSSMRHILELYFSSHKSPEVPGRSNGNKSY